MPAGSAGYAAHFDAQFIASSIGVQGTLGTADITGTAQTLPFAVDSATGAAWGKEIGTPSVILAGGTLQSGTMTNTGTNVNIVTGTINVGTFNNAGTFVNVSTGTQQTLGTVGVVNNVVTGTLAALTTVTTLSNLTNGSVNILTGTLQNSGTTTGVGVVTSVTNLVAGTLLNSGTTTGVGVVTALTSGSVAVTIGTVGGGAANAAAASGNPNPVGGTDSGGTIRTILVDSTGVQRASGSSVMTVGTITTGSLSNVAMVNAGTIVIPTGTITTGSLSNLAMINAGTIVQASGTTTLVSTVTTVSNLTNGSVILQSGTLSTGTLQNLVSGTINALAAGTITTGTISMTTGTLSPIPTIGQLTFGTLGTTGVTVFGTLAGGTSSGAGTEIFITSLSLSMPSSAGSQDVSIGWGTSAGTFHAGTSSLLRGNFPAGGGIQKQFVPPINSGTNAQLCYFQAGAGTVDINVTYFITPSTL